MCARLCFPQTNCIQQNSNIFSHISTELLHLILWWTNEQLRTLLESSNTNLVPVSCKRPSIAHKNEIVTSTKWIRVLFLSCTYHRLLPFCIRKSLIFILFNCIITTQQSTPNIIYQTMNLIYNIFSMTLSHREKQIPELTRANIYISSRWFYTFFFSSLFIFVNFSQQINIH